MIDWDSLRWVQCPLFAPQFPPRCAGSLHIELSEKSENVQARLVFVFLHSPMRSLPLIVYCAAFRPATMLSLPASCKFRELMIGSRRDHKAGKPFRWIGSIIPHCLLLHALRALILSVKPFTGVQVLLNCSLPIAPNSEPQAIKET